MGIVNRSVFHSFEYMDFLEPVETKNDHMTSSIEGQS